MGGHHRQHPGTTCLSFWSLSQLKTNKNAAFTNKAATMRFTSNEYPALCQQIWWPTTQPSLVNPHWWIANRPPLWSDSTIFYLNHLWLGSVNPDDEEYSQSNSRLWKGYMFLCPGKLTHSHEQSTVFLVVHTFHHVQCQPWISKPWAILLWCHPSESTFRADASASSRHFMHG